MDYGAGEKLILDHLRTLEGYTSSNTSRLDWGIRNSGASEKYAILRPTGEFEQVASTLSEYTMAWVTVIEIFRRYVDDGTTFTNLEDDMSAIINHFNPKRLLGDTTGVVLDSMPKLGGPLKTVPAGAPVWAVWECLIAWQEEETIVFSE